MRIDESDMTAILASKKSCEAVNLRLEPSALHLASLTATVGETWREGGPGSSSISEVGNLQRYIMLYNKKIDSISQTWRPSLD